MYRAESHRLALARVSPLATVGSVPLVLRYRTARIVQRPVGFMRVTTRSEPQARTVDCGGG